MTSRPSTSSSPSPTAMSTSTDAPAPTAATSTSATTSSIRHAVRSSSAHDTPIPASPSLLSKLQQSKARPWVLLTLRLILGAIFLYAGYLKALDPLAFADSISTYQLLPPAFINILALALPPLEILLGAWLITGIQPRYPTFGILALSTIFALAITQGLLRSLTIDCGCFGGPATSPAVTLARDIAIILAAAVLYADQFAKRSE